MAEALVRHTKARDVFPCLGLYPETAQPGSRKIHTWRLIIRLSRRVTC